MSAISQTHFLKVDCLYKRSILWFALLLNGLTAAEILQDLSENLCK
jgi:hypothetical protein